MPTHRRVPLMFASLVLFLVLDMVLWQTTAEAQPTWGRPKAKNAGSDGVEEPGGAGEPDGKMGTGAVAAPQRWTDDDPEQKQPSADGEPGVWYAARAQGGKGQRYLWVLPDEFERGKGFDVVVLLHGARQNVRFGLSTHSSIDSESGERFRPHDIFVCVDGLSIVGRTAEDRGFVPSEESILAFREIMLEMSRSFPVRRFYLYGIGSGADFALAFSARFPALAEGVLMYRPTGLSGEIATAGAGSNRTPLVIVQGSRDGLQNIGVSIALHRLISEKGHPSARFRALPAFNDYPNPVRVSECVDWAAAMNASDPAEVLERAKAILTPKGTDEYGYVGPVWFAGAYEALARITGRGIGAADAATSSSREAPESEGVRAAPLPTDKREEGVREQKPLEGITDEMMAEATALQNAIEAHAALHIDALKALLGPGVTSAEQIVPDGSPAAAWLWHVRQDFRGVTNVEAFVSSLGYDAVLDEHVRVGGDLVEAYDASGSPAEKAQIGAELGPRCFLAPTLPMSIGEAARAAAKGEELESEVAEAVELLGNVEKTWNEGARAYAKLWRQWSLPEQGDANESEEEGGENAEEGATMGQ